ncbi:MAG TPA: ammonium transporter [Gaiellaceae bacterium]|nr:ammonium transporter [Gaiellaceae bacterium]
MIASTVLPYPTWLNPGDNAWQLTAATLVGLMSVPGLVVLYGGVMQKRWSVNSMMLAFLAFAAVLIVWVLWGFDMAFGHPWHGISDGSGGFIHGFLGNFIGQPGAVLNHAQEQGQANIPLVGGPPWHFPQSTLVYFQFVFAAITPLLMLGSVLGRINIKAWIVFVPLWISGVYVVNAFLIWGGGWFAHKGALDFSGGYVIHLAAGVAGFVAAWVIGPRLARDREIDAPNNLLMVATGAGLLWLGWNGFNGGDPYYAGADASSAVLNTNLCTAVALLVWIAWDYITGRKPSLIGTVNGMIVGLVAITPAAGFVNGYGAILIGVISSSVVYVAYNYVSRMRPFRNVDDTLGVIYTHGFAGVVGGLCVGLFADSRIAVTVNPDGTPNFSGTGSLHQLWVQAYTALWVICFTAVGTFILLKLVGLVIPLRMSDEELEIGDVAIHGHEVYPSDIPSLGYAGGIPGLTAPPSAATAMTATPPPPPPAPGAGPSAV